MSADTPLAPDLDALATDGEEPTRMSRIEALISAKQKTARQDLNDRMGPRAVPVDYTPSGTVHEWAAKDSTDPKAKTRPKGKFIVRASFFGYSATEVNAFGQPKQIVRTAQRGDVIHINTDDVDEGTEHAIDRGYLQPYDEE